MIARQRAGLKIPLALAGVVAVLFYLALFVGQPLLSTLILRMPQNYESLVNRFLERREQDRAIEVCRREIVGKGYDVRVHRRWGEILDQMGRKTEALDVLWNLPESHRAVRARAAPSHDWDEALLRLLLARILWDVGRVEESLDQLQAAHDTPDPTIKEQCAGFVAAISRTPDVSLLPWTYAARAAIGPAPLLGRIHDQMTSARLSAPPSFYTRLAQLAANRQQFSLAHFFDSQELLHHGQATPSLLAHGLFLEHPNWPERRDTKSLYVQLIPLTAGYFDFQKPTDMARCLAEYHWAHLFQTTVTTGTATLSRKSRGICIAARGTVCDDVWPILSIRVSGRTVGQRYVRSATYQAYTVPLELPPGKHTIGVGFENDAISPILKQDRNLEIREIRFY